MNDYFEKIKAWKQLLFTLQNIQPGTREIYHNTLLLYAIKEWGFNPESPQKIEAIASGPLAILDEWEKLTLERIRVFLEYGIDTGDKGFPEQNDVEQNMYFFIKGGGSLCDIPKEIRTGFIVELYLRTLKKVYEIE